MKNYILKQNWNLKVESLWKSRAKTTAKRFSSSCQYLQKCKSPYLLRIYPHWEDLRYHGYHISLIQKMECFLRQKTKHFHRNKLINLYPKINQYVNFIPHWWESFKKWKKRVYIKSYDPFEIWRLNSVYWIKIIQ